MGKRLQRLPRTRSTPREEDEQTELEVGLGSSGRSSAHPKDRLFGSHPGRFEPERSQRDRDAALVTMPRPRGSAVAPTPLAEKREQERHRLERKVGRKPAGEQGRLRAARGPQATRDALVAAQKQADRDVVGHEVPSRSR